MNRRRPHHQMGGSRRYRVLLIFGAAAVMLLMLWRSLATHGANDASTKKTATKVDSPNNKQHDLFEPKAAGRRYEANSGHRGKVPSPTAPRRSIVDPHLDAEWPSMPPANDGRGEAHKTQHATPVTAQVWALVYALDSEKSVLDTQALANLDALAVKAQESQTDLRILLCDPNPHSAAVTEFVNRYDRVHLLDGHSSRKPLLNEYYGEFNIPLTPQEAAMDSLLKKSEKIEHVIGDDGHDGPIPSRGVGLGFHALLIDAVRRVKGEWLMVLSPSVLRGSPAPSVFADSVFHMFSTAGIIRSDAKEAAGDVIAARIVTAAPGDHTATERPQIISHGFSVGEIGGGRGTLYPRFAGMHAADPRDLEPSGSAASPPIVSPSAVAALLSFARLDERLKTFVLEGGAHASRCKPETLQQFAALPPELAADVALAMLHFGNSIGTVSAAPVEFQFAEPRKRGQPAAGFAARAGGDASHPRGKYLEALSLMAGGGEPAKFSPGVNLFAPADAVLPACLTGSPEFVALAKSKDPTPARNSASEKAPSPGEIVSDVTLYWDTYCSCTGINIECINFLVPLERRMQVRAVANPDCWCQGFPTSDRAALNRLMTPKLGSGIEVYPPFDEPERTPTKQQAMGHFDDTKKSIWVTHKPVDAFPKFPYHGAIEFSRRPTYHVGRTMIEVDRINSNWVRTINDDALVDEIWVPSQFLVDAFYDSGVKPSRLIYVIPEAIDVHFYDPSRYGVALPEPSAHAAMPGADEDEGEDSGNVAEERKKHRPRYISSSGVPPPVDFTTSCPECFRFFTNFKWETRKGWEALLTAYFTTFSIDDPVILFIKTFLYLDPTPHDTGKIEQRILQFVAKELKKKDKKRLARFVVLADESEAADMPALYAQMDAFVLPTFGEGWGLPFQEAMAMGLPAIGTNWGGNVEFMNSSNSLLIEVEGLVAADGSFGGGRRGGGGEGGKVFSVDRDKSAWTSDEQKLVPGRRGKRHHESVSSADQRRPPRWAKPSAKHLAQLMRWLVAHPISAKVIGARGRATMVERYSREAVADVVVRRLAEIIKENPSRF